MNAFYKETELDIKNNLNAWITKSKENRDNQKKDKIYFAAPWFSDKAKAVYDYVEKIAELYNYKDNIIFPREITSDTVEDMFQADLEAIKQCDYVLAFISERDMGVAFEMGYAFKTWKPIILLVYSEEDLNCKTNLMLAKCAEFYTTLKNVDCLFLKHYGGVQDIHISKENIE